MSLLSVMPATTAQQSRAEQVAHHFHWPLVAVEALCPTPLLLWVGPTGLALKSADGKHQHPITAQLQGGSIGLAGPDSWVRGQPLARAVGIKGQHTPTVVDATAGLGGDGWLMARMGCSMHWAERVPLMGLLLQEGLEQAHQDAQRAEVARRVTLHQADAIQLLQNMQEPPQVVYLDPMFPHEGKGSLPRKAMVQLRQLAGEDQDLPQLFELAMATAEQRVVLKRPLKAPLLTRAKPNFQLKGRSTRFDVYATG
ncbi:protein of unknown function DUF548 [Magnetococcus marinus MC-1]|uniref:Ribosomal RNA small subunit methyltransferase J n=1 Tax=Magnetococcus marinus (strain ATCC BAA-1437 / JCM 17883 / MC-1) TaxID=156889 RepID=RSMJ_MAGMM|nr:class I SAM-dependent methyltransferase [Magnetococcus marinus]A0L8U7.1 RecName: Full=Ribosomal RNA small subunit methyltransferase J; AltName: Full=16S rRNA m2G1516 methyltransferase; AltName: Full=rRNA (guanine-N(2)-)-methyltransferase [Magnetococcus marinus MC-1]ABK44390.1 protein of unknown function DUF548 [Magnetococcus marinus MC-1]